jgi:hypothetical protein
MQWCPRQCQHRHWGQRGVVVVDGGMLAEVDAGGSSVGYSGVVDEKLGWVRDGWAAGQGDSKD